MCSEPEPSLEDWGLTQQQRGGAYVPARSVSTGGGGTKSQPLVEPSGVPVVGSTVPDTARPGTLTSRNTDPDGSSPRARPATATLSLMSPASPSRSARPDFRWNTSAPSAYDADATRTANGPDRPTARAAIPAPDAAMIAPFRTRVCEETQIRGRFGNPWDGRRSITRPRRETSQLSEPRRRIAAGCSGTIVIRRVCGKARS